MSKRGILKRKAVKVFSWKPLCISMPPEELTAKCFHTLEADEEHRIIRCLSCKKEWLGIKRRG